MSGICGMVRLDGQSVRKKDIRQMLDAMQNRGNDAEGIHLKGNIGFGHKMLVSTPESLHEHQPVISQDGQLIITADARIDNREELIKELQIKVSDDSVITDVELILLSYVKWREECPKHLFGDFAFVIFDTIRQTIFLTRDHIGIRPFFYYMDDTYFCFSSEISSLLASSHIEKAGNFHAIETFLKTRILGYEETFFQNIKRLIPAHYGILSKKKINILRYWFPEKILINNKISFKKASEKFLELLHIATYDRLRSVSSIGCELSGGLDSSSILCMAARINRNRPIVPFSQRYGNLECDESYYSDLVAKSLDLDVQTVRVDQLDFEQEYSVKNYLNLFPDWPTYGSFIGILPLAKKMKEQKIRVLLTGQGGDHIVAGNYYLLADYLKTFKFKQLFSELQQLKWSKKMIKNYILRPYILACIIRLKRFLMLQHSMENLNQNSTYFDKSLKTKYKLPFSLKKDIGYISGAGNSFWSDSNVYHSIERYNIETRHPYFDIRLVEFCLSLPADYKLESGVSKRIMREALRNILPDPIRERSDKAEFSHAVEKQLNIEYNLSEVNEIQAKLKYGIITSNNTLTKSIVVGIVKWYKRNLN